MTVTSTINSATFPGSGSTGPFSFGFRVLQAADLVATVTDALGNVTVLVRGTDYTLTGLPYGLDPFGMGGIVDLTDPLATGSTLELERIPAILQERSFQNAGPFFAKNHEDAFDLQTMIAQYLSSKITGGVVTPPSVILDAFNSPGDFTAGVTTQLILSSNPVSSTNLTITFRTNGVDVPVMSDQYSLLGAVVTFTAPIPALTTRVEVKHFAVLTAGGGGSISPSFVVVNGLTTAAINIGIAAATAAGIGLYFPPGTYLCSATSIIDSSIPLVFGAGDATILQAQAGFTGSAILQYGKNEAGAPKELTSIRNLKLDGNGKGVDGLVVYKCQNLTLDYLHVRGCRYGFFFDDQFDLRILNVLLKSCYTGGSNGGDPNTVGYKFDGTAQVGGSFDTFRMESCASESDATGVWILGKLSNHLFISGSELQGQTVAAIHADGASVALMGTFIETATPATIPGLQLVNGTIATQDASTSAAYPSIDATSKLIVGGGSNVNSYRYSATAALGTPGDPITGAVEQWGPPNFPVDGRGGSVSYVGQVYTDPQGVRWICRKAGSTVGAPYSRWDAMDGEIRIPMDLTTLTNGEVLWWPQNDFILESIDFVCTTTGVGALYFTLGTTGGDEISFIDSILGAIANLVAGNVISAYQDGDPTAKLSPRGVRYAFLGGEFNAAPTARLSYFKDGVFSAGAGTLIIRGHYPEVGTRGTTTLQADPASGERLLFGGWSQATPMAISETGADATDAVSARGRKMIRAGSLTAISVELTAVKTAGSLAVVVSYSTDNRGSWTNFVGDAVVPNGVFSYTVLFAVGANPYPAGALLRVQWTTDGSWAPTVNNMDVSIEVTQ